MELVMSMKDMNQKINKESRMKVKAGKLKKRFIRLQHHTPQLLVKNINHFISTQLLIIKLMFLQKIDQIQISIILSKDLNREMRCLKLVIIALKILIIKNSLVNYKDQKTNFY